MKLEKDYNRQYKLYVFCSIAWAVCAIMNAFSGHIALIAMNISLAFMFFCLSMSAKRNVKEQEENMEKKSQKTEVE